MNTLKKTKNDRQKEPRHRDRKKPSNLKQNSKVVSLCRFRASVFNELKFDVLTSFCAIFNEIPCDFH